MIGSERGPERGPASPRRRARRAEASRRGPARAGWVGPAAWLGLAGLTVLAACGGEDGSDAAAIAGSDTTMSAVAGADDGAETDAATTAVSADPVDTVSSTRTEVDLTSFALAADLDEIWASTGDRTVCSPAEPATAMVRFAPADAVPDAAADEVAVEPVADPVVDVVVAMLWWETPGGELRRQVLQRDGDAWVGTFGPTRAKRSMEDLAVELAAVGFDASALERLGLDAEEIAALADALSPTAATEPTSDTTTDTTTDVADGTTDEARAAIDALSLRLVGDESPALADVVDQAGVAAFGEVTVLAPVACGNDQTRDRRGRSRTDAELTVELARDVADGVEIWATSDGACSDGPSSIELVATTTGRPTGVRAQWTLPSGAVGSTSLRRGDTTEGVATWQGRIGPFGAQRSMPQVAELPVTVTARDADGDEATASTVMVVRRPLDCAAAGPTSTGPTTAAPGPATTGAEPLSITGTVSGGELWATAAGLCTNGATTLALEARTTGPAAEVQVRVTLPGGGTLATVTLSANGAGRWRGTLGPIAAQQSMPDSGAVTLQFGARAGAGSNASDSRSITLRRPTPCPSTSPPVTSPPPTSSPTTSSPTTSSPTTSPPVTTPPTTSPPTAAPVAVTVSGNVNGSQISASANGACPTVATSVAVGARTTGAVTEVQVRVLAPGGAVLQTISLSPNGDGRWGGSIGPLPGNQGMPDTSTLTVQFGARAGGTNASDTRSITLLRPPPCA